MQKAFRMKSGYQDLMNKSACSIMEAAVGRQRVWSLAAARGQIFEQTMMMCFMVHLFLTRVYHPNRLAMFAGGCGLCALPEILVCKDGVQVWSRASTMCLPLQYHIIAR